MGGYLNSAEGSNQAQCVIVNEVVPIIGFELMTYRLQGGCSTN